MAIILDFITAKRKKAHEDGHTVEEMQDLFTRTIEANRINKERLQRERDFANARTKKDYKLDTGNY